MLPTPRPRRKRPTLQVIGSTVFPRRRSREIQIGGVGVALAHPDVLMPEDGLARFDASGKRDSAGSRMPQLVRRPARDARVIAGPLDRLSVGVDAVELAHVQLLLP